MKIRIVAPAIVVLAMGALIVGACGKQDTPAPQPASPPAAAEPGEPIAGTPRVVVAADGVHVQYRVYGSGEPAIVLIHGWSCDSNYWREQVPELAKKYTVVTVDLAGHGGTDGNRSEWTMARFGQDVSAALATVPNEKLVLVGHSMGGPVAIEAARLLKSRAIGIIGVDTFKSIGAPPPSKPQVDAIMKKFEADFIGTTRSIVTSHFFAPGANEELKRKIAYDMSLSPPRVGIPSMRAVMEYDFTEPLKNVSVPIVAINSNLGEPVNEARIRKVLPKFRQVTLDGTGHFLMMEAPARFNPALESEIEAILLAASQ
jgi:pimeloyl-ACP methyl ester carboxylesterase